MKHKSLRFGHCSSRQGLSLYLLTYAEREGGMDERLISLVAEELT